MGSINYYDVIIIGAGVAGTGLTYNLKKKGYKGSVLILDKKGLGVNAAYGYRNTFKDTVNNYGLPYVTKFKGVEFGDFSQSLIKLEHDFYFIDYKQSCNKLFLDSAAEFKKQEVVDVDFKKNILKTNSSKYNYKFLVDASGSNFFIRKKLNLDLPKRYWLGKLRVFTNKQKIRDNYFYHLINNNGDLEDFYVLDNKILIGDWKYHDKKILKVIKEIPSYNKNKINKEDLLFTKHVVIPCALSLPLKIKNIAFLGDSFGNATASAGEGITPILNTSEILAEALYKDDLRYYEKTWLKQNYNLYIKHLVPKMLPKYKMKMFKTFIKYPNDLVKILKNENMSKKLVNAIPLKIKLLSALKYFQLHMGYAQTKLKHKLLTKF